MTHEGHMVLFKNMSKYGDVIVSVLDNETVESYKYIHVILCPNMMESVHVILIKRI